MPNLRERFYSRLRGNPYPLFVFDECITPAAAIWAGARHWVRAFREAGMQPGDRIVLALPPSSAFLQVLVAGLWEGYTLIPVPPGEPRRQIIEEVDARWCIGLHPQDWQPDGCAGPQTPPPPARQPHLAPTPDASLLLRTSGTGGMARWIALSDANLSHALETHLPALGYTEAETRLLSVLPWHHAFGLILDLLPALCAGAEVLRDPESGRNAAHLLQVWKDQNPTHVNAVPRTLQQLLEQPCGPERLRALTGGIVGGAAIDSDLAAFLRTTRLRAGYGQTEASPGICLGAPGYWPGGGYLGAPIGTRLRRDSEGQLLFQGAGACLGTWSADTGLALLPAERWHPTGDLVEESASGDLYYLGRLDDRFKLANGRWITPEPYEKLLKDACPLLGDVLLKSDSAGGLQLLYSGHAPPVERLQAYLGTPGRYLSRVSHLPKSCWHYTPKGSLNRRLTKESQPGIHVGPDSTLSCEDIEAFALRQRPEVRLSDAGETAMADSAARCRTLIERGVPLYGTTTGFGPFVRFRAGDSGGYGQGASLIAHLCAGSGADAPQEHVRAAMLVRAQNLAQGYSGVRPSLISDYLKLLESEAPLSVPTLGSVGASGDLVPLAHLASALAARTPLTGREALALTNGTSFLTGVAALALARSERLLAHAECLTGWAYRLLGCRAAALDPRLQQARGHSGQQQSAAHILREAGSAGPWEDSTRPLQEVYSFRCAPQVLGACRDQLFHARQLIEREINGVSDNPLFAQDEQVALHGGNFHGQQVAFAADALNAALTQTGVLAERQLDALVTPSVTNQQAPLLLAWEPGPCSGLAGVQLTATALVAELRAHCQMHATFSIPTNAGNQDVVSMGALAARSAWEQTERVAGVLAALALGLYQLNHLRLAGRAPGRASAPPTGMPVIAPIIADRPLRAELAQLARYFTTALPALPD